LEIQSREKELKMEVVVTQIQKLERGPDLAGYAEWKSVMSSEACLSSEASIQEVSS